MNFPPRLMEGYQAFVGGRLPRERGATRNWPRRARSPRCMLVGCCDSARVARGHLRRAARRALRGAQRREPGAAFRDRRRLPLGTSAALEFAGAGAAASSTSSSSGTRRCGGIRAYADDQSEPLSPGDFIGKWMNLVKPAAEQHRPARAQETLDAYAEKLALRSVLKSLENLMTLPVRAHPGGARARSSSTVPISRCMTGVLAHPRSGDGANSIRSREAPLGRVSVMGCTEA